MSVVYDLNEDVEVANALNSDNDDFDETIEENIVGSRRKRQKKWSPVWEYFDEIQENGNRYAVCKLCIDEPTRFLMSGRSNGSTGNLTRHLAKDHVGEVVLNAFKKNDEVFVFSQDNFRKALIKWIVISDQPFTEPQQETFVELVHTLNRDAEIITDKTVKADIIETYSEKLEVAKNMVALIPGKMSISLDGWTSRNVLPFFAIRVHWLDAEWKYHSILLDFSYVHGKHSGWKHSCIFRDCLTRLNIPITKILGVTGDNAGSNDTFFHWMEEHGLSSLSNQIRCMCHVINLAVQDCLNLLKIRYLEAEDDDDDDDDYDYENEVLEDIDINEDIDDDEEPTLDVPIDNTAIIAKLRKIVRKIRKSVKKRQKLKKCCQIHTIEYRVPIIDVKTRWNSTYHMIIRAIYLKKALQTLCFHEKSLVSLQMSDEEWAYLSVIEKLLAKFDRATKLMSMERHSTIHSYIPTLNWLIDSVKEFARQHSGTLRHAAEGGLMKLNKYKLNVDECIIPFIATILHPALKLTYFKEQGYTSSEIREIKKAVSEYFTTNYETLQLNVEVDSTSGDELYDHMFKRSRIEKTTSEFLKYLNLPLAYRKVDALDYWKAQSKEFSHLSLMARDILSSQSASTSVERDFSKGSKMVTPTRCSMLQTTIKACMSLKSWYSF